MPGKDINHQASVLAPSTLWTVEVPHWGTVSWLIHGVSVLTWAYIYNTVLTEKPSGDSWVCYPCFSMQIGSTSLFPFTVMQNKLASTHGINWYLLSRIFLREFPESYSQGKNCILHVCGWRRLTCALELLTLRVATCIFSLLHWVFSGNSYPFLGLMINTQKPAWLKKGVCSV